MKEGNIEYRDNLAENLKTLRNIDKDLAMEHLKKVQQTSEYKDARERHIEQKDRITSVEELYEKLPYIKFPADWEIKFIMSTDTVAIHFSIKKEGAPYKVSVILCVNYDGNGYTFWEAYNGGDDTPRVSVKDIDGLMKVIEDKLYNIYDEPYDPSDNYEEEQNPEGNNVN